MQQHVADLIRILYKRRWAASGVFLLVVAYGATNTLRKTPTYDAAAQLLIEDGRRAETSASAGTAGSGGGYETQVRILRSRALAWDALKTLAMDAPPTPQESRELAEANARRAQGGWLGRVARLAGAPHAIEPPADESGWQSARVDRFLAGLEITPIEHSRLVSIEYRAADPSFTARAANAVATSYLARGYPGQLIDPAEIPRVPVLPNHQRHLMLAMLAGLVLAVGLALSLEFLDSRIKTPDDIKSHLGLPFLGLIPVVPPREAKGMSPLTERGAPPAFAEAMRAIRTSVVFSSAPEGARTLVVTSTAPGEGKTVVAANLANALAQAEQRTLVIDADMRRPRAQEVFQLAQEPGLSNVLAGTADVHTAIRQTSSDFLFVLPAGMIPPNPAELLGSPRCRKLLEELGREFDWIVVDSPPVMAVTDAAVVANGSSGVLFVVGADMTPRRVAQTALEQLAGARAHIIGAVLNRVNIRRHSYYYAEYYRDDYKRAYVRTP